MIGICWAGPARLFHKTLRNHLMGLIFLGILWAASILTVLSITNYYKNPRSQNRLISAVVFLGFHFPLSITFVLPIDVSSVHGPYLYTNLVV